MESSKSHVAALNTAAWAVTIAALYFLSGEAEAVPASKWDTSNPIQSTSLQVVVDGRERIATVGHDFICATLDWWPPAKCNYGSCPWYNVSLLTLDLENSILERAVQALAPLKIRLGGTLQDVIEYDIGPLLQPCLPLVRNASADFGFSGGCLPMHRWDRLNQFFHKTRASVAFGLNVVYGWHVNGTWDPSNSAAFIQYTHDEGYPVTAWELGNELLGIGGGLLLSPQLYAKNVRILRTIVNRVYENDRQKPLVVAPDAFYEVGNPDYQNFLTASGANVVDVVTRHMYNLGPGSTTTEDLVANILNQSYAKGEEDRYSSLQTVLEAYPWVKAWIGEAGGAYNSGHENVTDAFIMAFWYLDQLGLASKHNNQAFCRQSLIGGHYGLLDAITYVPNPDFYGALLWQELMGTGVLSVNSTSTDIRAYAHCQKGCESTKGGVTVLLLNYSNVTSYSVDVSVLGNSTISRGEQKHRKSSASQLEFHMSPDGGDIHSHIVLLNGTPLRLKESGDLPSLIGRAVNGSTPITVDPLTYTFVVLEDSSALACLPQSSLISECQM